MSSRPLQTLPTGTRGVEKGGSLPADSFTTSAAITFPGTTWLARGVHRGESTGTAVRGTRLPDLPPKWRKPSVQRRSSKVMYPERWIFTPSGLAASGSSPR